jgi:DNA-binding response OmpR family regulator
MVTARDEEVDRVLGLELGADDYVVKPYSIRELVSRVRALLRRAYGDLAAGGDERIRVGVLELDRTRMQASRGGRAVDLTPTEFRLVHHMARHPGRAFTRDQLIEAVWGYSSDIGYDRTVDVHVRHLRQKLEDDPAHPRHLVTVRGVGYALEP